MNPIIKRLLTYVQTRFGNKSNKPDVPPQKPSNERSFNRFSIGSEVNVTCLDGADEKYSETSELHDISGSGAMFISCFSERYFTGQQLRLDIFLAGTDAVRACIKTEASVVRIQALSSNISSGCEQGTGNTKMGIAVKFNLPFEFERMDTRD
ncbi:MAG: PilZ domain-containing protein [Desulfobacteraceae bacterium]|nr:MAG: PilZ domain-containing protein [Desulfobacteraceae bacterium]